MKVAVIGSGGREHTIAWALSKNPTINEIICIPGNGGTALLDKAKNCKPESSGTNATNNIDPLGATVALLEKECVECVVVGPEAPLVDGLVDRLLAKGIPTIGPTQKAAQLEGSKDFAKKFMEKHGVAAPKSKSFTDIESAKVYVKEQGTPIVIKADGLAAGKGVVVAEDEQTALDAIDAFMGEKTLGSAGNTLVIEEYLEGVEVSLLAAVSLFDSGDTFFSCEKKSSVPQDDAHMQKSSVLRFLSPTKNYPSIVRSILTKGSHNTRSKSKSSVRRFFSSEKKLTSFDSSIIQKDESKLAGRSKSASIVPFVPARDHKRLLDGAQGPNTGGMGAFAPVDDISEADKKLIQTTIVEPTLKGLIAEHMEYRGFIFFGLMLTKDGPKLLEYNVRLGDPETQVVLPLMDSDFFDLCTAIFDGSLQNFPLRWKKAYACAPVAVSGGYPGAYKTGCEIDISEFIKNTPANCELFIAGATYADGTLKTSGGRVLAVSARGQSFDEARKTAYEGLEKISFKGMFYRRDIGLCGMDAAGK